jgi:hypothetical protein
VEAKLTVDVGVLSTYTSSIDHKALGVTNGHPGIVNFLDSVSWGFVQTFHQWPYMILNKRVWLPILVSVNLGVALAPDAKLLFTSMFKLLIGALIRQT